jgi:hypothetical protein
LLDALPEAYAEGKALINLKQHQALVKRGNAAIDK